MTAKVTYLGSLRTQCEHQQSGASFVTDAPKDNQGKGEAFSPTDTVATALASCMLTIIGIKARDNGWDVEGATAEVSKEMAADPRRISRIGISIRFPLNFDEKTRTILERAARTCPVMYSLNPDIEVALDFSYPS